MSRPRILIADELDGRYKFSRYFAPVDRNKPGSVDKLYTANDVDLFDLQTDARKQ